MRRTMNVNQKNRMAAAGREPEIVESGGTARLHLTLATTDYDHVRDLVNGVVRADGIVLTGFRAAGRGNLFPLHQEPGMGHFRNVLRQVHRLCLARQFAVHRHSGISLARVPPFRLLCARRPRHQIGQGPRGQNRRHPGMGADRRHLRARVPERNGESRSHQNQMGAGRHERGRARGKGRVHSCPRASNTHHGATPA